MPGADCQAEGDGEADELPPPMTISYLSLSIVRVSTLFRHSARAAQARVTPQLVAPRVPPAIIRAVGSHGIAGEAALDTAGPSGSVERDVLSTHTDFRWPDITSLVSVLDLEQLEVILFRGHSPQDGWTRVFGGQVVGQALVAAARTVEGRLAHSLHSYFLLGGDPKVPIVFEVDRIRDGKSFTTRRVVAIQHGEAIFSMAVSFHKDEPGTSHQFAMPDTPDPDCCRRRKR